MAGRDQARYQRAYQRTECVCEKWKYKVFRFEKRIAASKPSIVVKSAPAGGGMTIGPTVIKAILTILPTVKPAIIPRMFLSIKYSPSVPDAGKPRFSIAGFEILYMRFLF
jgi:hypothetical protein